MPSSSLPTDIVELQRLLLQSMTHIEQVGAHNAQLTTALVDLETEKARSEARLHAQLEDIRKRMDGLIRRLFGRKTERIAVNQLRLFDDQALETAAQAVEDDKPEPEPEPS